MVKIFMYTNKGTQEVLVQNAAGVFSVIFIGILR